MSDPSDTHLGINRLPDLKTHRVIRHCIHYSLSKHCPWQWTLGCLKNGGNETRAENESTKYFHLGKEVKKTKQEAERGNMFSRVERKGNEMGVIQVWRPGSGEGFEARFSDHPSLQQLGVKKGLCRRMSQESEHLSIFPAHELLKLPSQLMQNPSLRFCTFWPCLILWIHLCLRVTSSHLLPPRTSSHMSLLPSASCMHHCPTNRGFYWFLFCFCFT